jgi:hypothetical protein
VSVPIRDNIAGLEVSATTTRLEGIAKAGATIEAINVTTAPKGRLHLDESAVDAVVVAKADEQGRFSGAVDSRTGKARCGDQLLVRARYKNGKTTDWVRVRVGGRDTRNALIAMQRIEASYDAASRKVLVVNNNEGRQISEPGATLCFTNERTGKRQTVTMNELGSFPGTLKLDGKPGDIYAVAASDGTNNREFTRVAGKLVVPKVDADTGDIDLPDPKLHKDDLRPDGTPKYQKVPFRGPVFHNGHARPEHVMQGNIGNCYCPAATAAVANDAEQEILGGIKRQADGTFVVTFKERKAGGKVINVHQHIDAELWVRSSGEPLYGCSAGSTAPDKMILWWPLIEKAYASWMGSYHAIGDGGAAEDVLEALTGRAGFFESFNARKPDAAWKLIQSAVEEKRPAVLSTFGESRDAIYTNTGIYSDHCYSILGCRVDSRGERWVKLRNPWGESEPEGHGKNDGIFEMKISEVCRLFDSFHSVE